MFDSRYPLIAWPSGCAPSSRAPRTPCRNRRRAPPRSPRCGCAAPRRSPSAARLLLARLPLAHRSPLARRAVGPRIPTARELAQRRLVAAVRLLRPLRHGLAAGGCRRGARGRCGHRSGSGGVRNPDEPATPDESAGSDASAAPEDSWSPSSVPVASSRRGAASECSGWTGVLDDVGRFAWFFPVSRRGSGSQDAPLAGRCHSRFGRQVRGPRLPTVITGVVAGRTPTDEHIVGVVERGDRDCSGLVASAGATSERAPALSRGLLVVRRAIDPVGRLGLLGRRGVDLVLVDVLDRTVHRVGIVTSHSLVLSRLARARFTGTR